jgi:hypothetical protein
MYNIRTARCMYVCHDTGSLDVSGFLSLSVFQGQPLKRKRVRLDV